MTKYKVIFIDWDGTLSNSRFWSRWIGDAKYDQIQDILFDKGKSYVRLWMTGFLSYTQILKYIESQTGISYESLEHELQYSAEHMNFIDEEVLALIDELRSHGIKVVIATDNMDTFRLWTIPSLKLETLFDGILVSDSLGALKTEFHDNGTSRFFQHYLSQNGISPGQSVLIDNSLDVGIVSKIGIDFLHVNNSTSLTQHLEQLAVNNN